MRLCGLRNVALEEDYATGWSVPSIERRCAETLVPSKPMMSNWPTCWRRSRLDFEGMESLEVYRDQAEESSVRIRVRVSPSAASVRAAG